MSSAEFRVFSDGSVVRGLREFNSVRGRESVWRVGRQIYNAEIRQPVLAFETYEVALEHLSTGQHDLRTIGDDLPPEFPPWIAHRRGHQTKRASARIRANVKQSVVRIRRCSGVFRDGRTWMMFRVVFVIVFSCSDEPEFSAGLVGRQVAYFAGCMTRGGQKKKTAAPRPFDFNSKPFVRLFVDEWVRFGRAQNMPIQTVGSLRSFVFDGIEQRPIVGGPGDAGDAFESLGESCSGTQIFDLQHVLSETDGIGRIRQQVIVLADFKGLQSQKRMAFRK